MHSFSGVGAEGETISSVDAAELHRQDVVQSLPAAENQKFYPGLDGLRAIAVLMVFYLHYLNFYVALNWGWTGVDLFFVLSGFLITGILFDTQNALHRFRNFYVRRALRIFPLYYGVLLLAVALNPVFHWEWHAAHILVPLYLTNFSRFIWIHAWTSNGLPMEHLRSSVFTHPQLFFYMGHFWSLAVEEQFYLVWPLVVFSVRDRARLRNVCLAMCVVCLIARVIVALTVPRIYLDAELLPHLTPFRTDALMVGGALALMLRGPEAQALRRWIRPLMVGILFCVLLLEGIVFLRFHHWIRPNVSVGKIDTLGLTVIDWFAGMVILMALEPGRMLYRFLTLKPLRRLGQVSYGFYVFHDIPHSAYGILAARLTGTSVDSFGSKLAAACIAMICTLALSFLSFRFFEAPFLRLKSRFAD